MWKASLRTFWPALVWLGASTVALCLPGDKLPQRDWFDFFHLDLWIHVAIFIGMVFLWCVPLLYRTPQTSLTSPFSLIAVASFGYGIIMEVVQHFLIAYRSFDIADILADAAGCFMGFMLVKRIQKHLTDERP